VLVRQAQWTPDDVIRISFLEGDDEVQGRARDVVGLWTAPGMANLILDFRRGTDTLIRISFAHDCSCSSIGATCRHVTHRQEPTMNYGWLDRSPPTVIGHAPLSTISGTGSA
jgi:hypothetical protein